jgi:ABC-type phosphate transport system substrate-binding protein
MKNIKKVGISAVGALALVAAMATPAHADVQALGADVVGVGSDTVQFGLDFLTNGDANGDAGFNASSTGQRAFSFDATGEACGVATPSAQVVLRANAKPVLRPNGSGSGITAITADNGPTETINFVRASREPKAAEQTAAAAFGGLHVYQFATDNLQIAVSQKVATHAPAVISTSDLVKIYTGVITTWGQVTGYTGAFPTNTIHPILPQAGSGTRNFFLADLTAANGGVTVDGSYSGITVGQEHDPTLIESDADAISPFSTGKINLMNSNYCGATYLNVVTTLTATGNYATTRGLFILVRQRDVADTTGSFGTPFPFQPGGTKNWVQTLFAGTTSWVARGSNAAMITAAGLTPSYQDLGVVSSG